MARLAPRSDSKVRRISSSRAWVSTMMVTSSGMRFSSTSLRTKSKSVCEADGKADLDLLDADLDQHLEEAQLALRAHRLDQRLVAVAQVGAHPDRRLGDACGSARCGRPGGRRGRGGICGGVFQHGRSSVVFRGLRKSMDKAKRPAGRLAVHKGVPGCFSGARGAIAVTGDDPCQPARRWLVALVAAGIGPWS